MYCPTSSPLTIQFTCRSVALGAIFISYRRSDTAGESGRLSDDLIARFGAAQVFMDVDAIQPGRDFRKAIYENIGASSVVLAMIGPDWEDARGTTGTRRLDNENDYVRLEIATALQRDIPVVPVLVRGARPPKTDQLPEQIRDLAYRNSVELTHARWKSDVQVLIRARAPYLEAGAESHAETVTPAKGVTEIRPASDSGVVAPASAPPHGVDGAVIERISHELAFYIGPIAELVVKRAAKRCASLTDLCNVAAQEIEGSSERARFLAACRR